jgi:para-nitrobenzyl esterase
MDSRLARFGVLPGSLFVALVLGACQDTTANPGDGPATRIGQVVSTTAGEVSGEVVVEDGREVRIFRGIPYAAPPIGELRWRPPQPAEPWSGVRDATTWGNRCPQGGSTQGTGDIGEDCLALNVVTAAETAGDRLPVMVFFHGGGLTTGTGNSPLYNHTALPLEGVVLVTVNSRLGAIGYMAHPALTSESEHGVSGNYGTLDLIASLEWVRDNIAAFGGDPGNVLIFGESGGGTKTLSLMSSPLAEGLFHRAIVQSGAGSVARAQGTMLETAEAAGERLANRLGAGEAEDVLSAIREASWEEVIAAAAASDIGFSATLAVDGRVLPMSVQETFRTGSQHDVPLIVGANEGERSELEVSVPMLAGFMSSTATSNAYVYNFSHLPTGWRDLPCVAFHGLELPYVFGYVPEGLTVPTILFLAPGGGCTTRDPGADEMDVVVAQNAVRMWAAFARTGDPSVEGLVTWPAFTEENDRYLDIGYTLEVKEGIRDAYVAPPARE